MLDKTWLHFLFNETAAGIKPLETPLYSILILNCIVLCVFCRSSSFKEDDGTWKGNDDGKVVNNQPQRVMDDRNGLMPQAGYIGRYATSFTVKCYTIVIQKYFFFSIELLTMPEKMRWKIIWDKLVQW